MMARDKAERFCSNCYYSHPKNGRIDCLNWESEHADMPVVENHFCEKYVAQDDEINVMQDNFCN